MRWEKDIELINVNIDKMYILTGIIEILKSIFKIKIKGRDTVTFPVLCNKNKISYEMDKILWITSTSTS